MNSPTSQGHRISPIRAWFAAVIALGALLAGCSTGDENASSAPTTTAPPEQDDDPGAEAPPSKSAKPLETADDLVGEWSAPEAEWTVTFTSDGTFSEDYQGNEAFRTGKYKLADGIVSLIGDDGNTDDGEVEDEGIVFRLGTLRRT